MNNKANDNVVEIDLNTFDGDEKCGFRFLSEQCLTDLLV